MQPSGNRGAAQPAQSLALFSKHPWRPPAIFRQTIPGDVIAGHRPLFVQHIGEDPAGQLRMVSELEGVGDTTRLQQFLTEVVRPTTTSTRNLLMALKAERTGRPIKSHQRELLESVSREDRVKLRDLLPAVLFEQLQVLEQYGLLNPHRGEDLLVAGFRAVPLYLELVERAAQELLLPHEVEELATLRAVVLAGITRGNDRGSITPEEALLAAAIRWEPSPVLAGNRDQIVSREWVALSPWTMALFNRLVQEGALVDDAWVVLQWIDRPRTRAQAFYEMLYSAGNEINGNTQVWERDKMNAGGWRGDVDLFVDKWRSWEGSIQNPVVRYLEARLEDAPESAFRRPHESTKKFISRMRRPLQILVKDPIWTAMATEAEHAMPQAGAAEASALHPILNPVWDGHSTVVEEAQDIPTSTAFAFRILSKRIKRETGEIARLHQVGSREESRFVRDLLASGEYMWWHDPRFQTRMFSNIGTTIDGTFYPIYDRHGNFESNVVGAMLLLPGAGPMPHSHSGSMFYGANQLQQAIAQERGRRVMTRDGRPGILATISWDHPGHGHGPDWRAYTDLSSFLRYTESIIASYAGMGAPVVALGRSMGGDYLEELHARGSEHLAGAIVMGGASPMWTPMQLKRLLIQLEKDDGSRGTMNMEGLSLVLRHQGLGPQEGDRALQSEDVTHDAVDGWAVGQRPQFTFLDDLDARLGKMRETAWPFRVPDWSSELAGGTMLSLDQLLETDWSRLQEHDNPTWIKVSNYLGAVAMGAGIRPRTQSTLLLYGHQDQGMPKPESWQLWQRYVAAHHIEGFFNPYAAHDHLDPRRTTDPRGVERSIERITQFSLEQFRAWWAQQTEEERIAI